jgi:hypothetical protein
MTTDRQKAELGITALYRAHSTGTYTPLTSWSRHTVYLEDPLYLHKVLDYTATEFLAAPQSPYVPDALLNTKIK